MAQEKTGRQTGIWNWIDRIQGDKVIWMIVILLILYSIVTIFSSTSQLASKDVSRIDIFMEQMGNSLHLIWYFTIFIREVRMACLTVGNDEVIASSLHIKADIFNNRLFRIGKINCHKATDRRSHLVHETTVLHEVHILSILTDAVNIHCTDIAFIEHQ